jgi:two-component system, NtrC family, sensor histidine kinase HydH
VPSAAVSLRSRLLLLVVVGAVLPLSLIGAWLVNSSTRVGTDQLRERLSDAVAAEEAALLKEWLRVRSDLLLLSDNDVVWRYIASAGNLDAPAYLADVFATVHRAVARIVFTDHDGAARLTLPHTAGSAGPDRLRSVTAPAGDGEFVLHYPVRNDKGLQVGNMAAAVRSAALLGSGIEASASGAVLVVRDARSNALLIGPELEAGPAGRFVHEDADWLAVKRTLDEPPLQILAAAPVGPAVAPFARAARSGGFALAAVALLALALTAWLTTRLTRSVSVMAHAAQAIAAGDLEHRIETTRRDEIGMLGDALNHTAASLKQTLDSLAHQRSMAALGEFATSMAHEVRNAHTAITVDLQRLHAQLPSEEAQALLLRAMRRLGSVQTVVDGALRIARSGQLHREHCELRSIVHGAASAVQPWFAEKHATLVLSLPPSSPLPIHADSAALQTLLVNLLRNAAQAVPPGGQAALTLRVEPEAYWIGIRDNGPGMDEGTRSTAFAPFFTTRDDGTGLGLPIARQVALAHGGAIELESSPGDGTTVTVRLPATPAAVAPAVVLTGA